MHAEKTVSTDHSYTSIATATLHQINMPMTASAIFECYLLIIKLIPSASAPT
jgi:hypothetical protein